MDKEKILDKKWIVDMVGQYCSHIREQLEKHNLLESKYSDVESVRRCTDIGFSLGSSALCPMGYVKGEKGGKNWVAKARQCTSVICNEQGYLELEDPEYSWVSYTYCDFSYSLILIVTLIQVDSIR